MSGGQKSGTGAVTELQDKKVEKDTILSNSDKSQREAGRGLDGKGVQSDEYKEIVRNQRPEQKEPSK
ncbi:MAG: hypothetical protein DCF30_19240 [Hyphomicrobiales bacterium]|nr:MAG: hypothetical protein DCF30_19240 [Hyphomicrobiales bacterium]